MPRVRPSDAAIPTVAGGAAAAMVVLASATALDWLFVTLCYSALLFAGRQVWWSWRGARRERRRAQNLQQASITAVAREAVVTERVRLSADIESHVRQLMTEVGERATAALGAVDPLGDIAWIQARARYATSELRRQLGLLREADVSRQTAADQDIPRARLKTSDVVLALVVVAIAIFDQVVLVPLEHRTQSWLTVLLTTSTAATVLGRRTAPVLAAVTAACLLTFGALTGESVQDGLWIGVAMAILAWSLAVPGSRSGWLTLALLVVANLVSRQHNQPENLPLNAAVLTVAAISGAIVGRNRRRLTTASVAVAARRAEIEMATSDAVRAERRQVARELHDVVANAVSLVAVQAGAAEMLWPQDRDGSRQALGVIASTARQTVAELDRLLPGPTPQVRTTADLEALAQRMRAAGLDVHLDVETDPDPELMPVVYRVVQESMTNALRHASVSRVAVSVRRTAGLPVGRDGPGTTVVEVCSIGTNSSGLTRCGFGLIGLEERVEQVGGSLRAGPRPDQAGFVVTVELPDRRAVEAR